MIKITSILLISLSLSCNIFAAEINGTAKATATLSSSCRLSTTDVVFDMYDPTVTSYSASNQTLTINCTRGTAWTFYTGGQDTYSDFGSVTINGIRVTGYNQYGYMSLGTNRLLYQVQASDGAWNDDLYRGTNLAGSYKSAGTGDTQTLTIPYRMPPSQYAVPGNYVGNATAILLF